MTVDVDLERLRAELRRLWRASGGGTWKAEEIRGTCGQVHLYADGWLVAMPSRLADAELAAAAHNALPALWREIDRLRAARTLRVAGVVGDGGRVAWTGAPPAAA